VKKTVPAAVYTIRIVCKDAVDLSGSVYNQFTVTAPVKDSPPYVIGSAIGNINLYYTSTSYTISNYASLFFDEADKKGSMLYSIVAQDGTPITGFTYAISGDDFVLSFSFTSSDVGATTLPGTILVKDFYGQKA